MEQKNKIVLKKLSIAVITLIILITTGFLSNISIASSSFDDLVDYYSGDYDNDDDDDDNNKQNYNPAFDLFNGDDDDDEDEDNDSGNSSFDDLVDYYSGDLDRSAPDSTGSYNIDGNYWGNLITQANQKYPNMTDNMYKNDSINPGVAVRKNMSGNMPERNTAGPSGMFPQYYKGSNRNILLPDNREDFWAKEWATVTNGQVVFCAAYGYCVRYGKWDPTRYHFDVSTGVNVINEASATVSEGNGVYSYGTLKDKIQAALERFYNSNDSDAYYYYHLRTRDGSIVNDGYSTKKAGDPYVRASKKRATLENGRVQIIIESNVPGNLQNSLCFAIQSKSSGSIPMKAFSYGGDPVPVYATAADTRAAVEGEAGRITSELFSTIQGGTSTKDFSPSINDSTIAVNPGTSPTDGPIAIVLENSPHASDGYKQDKSVKYANNAIAYSFSSADNDYNAKNGFASKYNLNDIQGAYWTLLGQNPTTHVTANARNLVKKAKEYEQFVGEIKNGYSPKIIATEAQVIADRANQKYIVGPYRLDYLQHDDISYVKSIYLETDKGELIYDEKHSDIQVVMDGEGVKGSNGLLKEYPRKNQYFFVVFDASKAGFPTEVTLNAKFEYIKETHAEGYNLTSTAKGYRYNGHCKIFDEKYQMEHYYMTIDIYCDKGNKERVTYECDRESCDREHKATYYWNDEDVLLHHAYIDLYFPYIQMDEKEEYDKKAQTLIVTGSGQSNPITLVSEEPKQGQAPQTKTINGGPIYRVYDSQKVSVKINLTMELGGFVWLDENAGKEDKCDGKAANGEKRIPGMKVTIEAVNLPNNANVKTGITQPTTETAKKDGDGLKVGEYRFKGLNAMLQYRFIFEYNAQYYQPTHWAPSISWGTAEWKVNSNAKDSESEREKYNLGFKVIGAKRGTYAENANPSNDDVAIASIATESAKGNNKSYTRAELKLADAIDDYGLPTGKGDSSMQQYVQDCMLKAYTCGEPNSTNPDGLYPYPSLFVIDNKPVTNIYMRCFNHQPTQLYPNAYYINLGLNERQQSDIAVKKDIDHVTLEINGQVHTYTYDTLETRINSDDSWTIGVNTSDAFKNNYGTSYTRELYKSDYLYKASNYGAAASALGKNKSDELEVYITYKIMVRNQANSIRARIDELVDYYDEDLQYVDERSYIQIKSARKNAAQKGIYPVKANYNPQTEASDSLYDKDTITGYKNLYIRGLGQLSDDKNSYNNYLAAGQTAYVYLTFRVKKDTIDGEDWIKLDEDLKTGNPIGVGKENIIEINGYSTQYAPGTEVPNRGVVSYRPAGILDRDSSSGNVKEAITHKDIASDSSELNKLEDDTGKAPNMRIILYRDDNKNRVIEGNIFEDIRNQSDKDDLTTTGNGIKEDPKIEQLIDGVTVQLVEIMENGQEFVWREFGTGATPENRNENQFTNISGYKALAIDESGNKAGGSGRPDSGKEETPIINYTFADNTKLVQNHNFGEDVKGAYAFKSFIPGKYVVRYIYGDTIKTVVPSSLGGLNGNKSYNGQDYKSTTYQLGVEQNKVYTWEQTPVRVVPEGNGWREWNQATDSERLDYQYFYKTYNKDENKFEYKTAWILGERQVSPKLAEVPTFKDTASNNERVILPTPEEVLTSSAYNIPVITSDKQIGYLYDITASDNAKVNNENIRPSDAKDIESRRFEVNNYSNAGKAGVTNYLAEVLASHKADYETMYDRATLLKDLINNTQMRAETGLIVIDLEYDTQSTEYNKQTQGQYRISNVDFGLEERPKAQIEIEKQIANVKLVRADGATLFDASDTATNVTWRKHQDYRTGYKNKMLDPDIFGTIAKIREDNKNKFGLVQLTMDEELMHGATIQITYTVKVTNVGEVDYYNIYYYGSEPIEMQDRLFYYKGEKSQNAQIVTTRADQVLDYVANNLQFNAETNGNWHTIDQRVVITGEPKTTLVNGKLSNVLQTYNTIISTENLNKDLVPVLADKNNASTMVPLVLTQMITAENDTDDLTYRNIVEIVKTTNTVGRRMEYSVVGNQDPTENPQELDSDKAEIVRILPPFGNAGLPIMIIAVTIAGAALAVGGIIFIKKKVLNK